MENINAYEILVANLEGVRPLYRCRWEDNIKMNLKGIVCEGVDWGLV
jgi:hypothetical protein